MKRMPSVGLAWLCLGIAGVAAAAVPRIEHTPVTVGMRGQPLMIRARVVAQGPAVKSVTLHYSASRDAAPFAVPMQATTGEAYIGTIPAGIVGSVETLTYYLSAEDAVGATAETPWTTVRIQGTAGSAVSSGRPGWVKPALIGGGVVLAAGAAAIIIDQSGGSSGGGGGGIPADVPGTYRGSSTQCETLSGAPPVCDTRIFSVTIGTDGKVSSSSLRPGVTMETQLSGSSFVLSSRVKATGTDGEIRYAGNVSDGRLFGSIEGSSGSGTNAVVYTGAFSANKQP